MLSYRHSFHAGNFADVLKHIVLINIIKLLKKKEKGFLYLDTHSGAGKYSLNSLEAAKTGEYKNGIAKLWKQKNIPEIVDNYLTLIEEINLEDKLVYYPGSPLLAMQSMRPQDRMIFNELHSSDYPILKNLSQTNRKVKVFSSDGFQQIITNMPPKERRGFVLVDPSYEIKSDYQEVVTAITEGYKRFATGCYAIWYPIIYRSQTDELLNNFKNTQIKNILNLELAISKDTNSRGMTASGMLIINPPWLLEESMREVLPFLNKQLTNNNGSYKIEWIN